MLLHLGLDRIMLLSSLGQVVLPFDAIDKSLSQNLIDIYKKVDPDTIYVITGPGSFTNVRVGTLALDTLAMMTGKPYHVMQVDKISLAKALWSEGIFPSSIVMYVGQRKNLWHYNFAYSDTYDVINHDQAILLSQGDCVIDMMFEFDSVFSVIQDKTVRWLWLNNAPHLLYQSHYFNCALFFSSVESIQPYYAIDANIG